MTRPSTRARSQYLAECEAGRVPRPHTEADARAYFVEQQQTRLRGEELNFAFVESANDDAVLEGCSLYYVDVEQSRAAVGYWLAPELEAVVSRPTPSGYSLDEHSQSWAWPVSG